MCSRLRDVLVLLFASSAVMATASSVDGVRFAASPSVVQMRIEVRSVGGTLFYDSEWKNGNVLDWALLDSFGHPLPYGAYQVRMLSKDLAGQTTEKQATLRAESGGVAAIDGQPSEIPKITLTAHDGETGQLVTTSGDLSFRFGDFLNRKDAEVMRLSAQGDLDVVGFIRTGKGIVFPDGSIQRSAAMPTIVRMRPSNAEPDKKLTPKGDISGAGTTNQVTKWLDGPAGRVGDSAITEVGGKVGIGTTNPGGQLHIYGPDMTDVFAGMGPDLINGPGFNYGYAGGSFGVGAAFFNVRPAPGATGVNPSLRFMTVNVERLIVTNSGNVGIGTSAPTEKLDVSGNVKASGNINATGSISGGSASISGSLNAGAISGTTASFTGDIISTAGAVDVGTQFKIAGIRVLSSSGNNLFVGPDTAPFNTGYNNLFVGTHAGFNNRSGFYNTAVGYAAGEGLTTGSVNSYFGALAGAAGGAGGANSYFGYQAGVNMTSNDNSFFGYNAGAGIPSGTASSNSAFGFVAGENLTTGSENAFFGFASGNAVTSGNRNTFVGDGSGQYLTSGSYNAFFGYQSGYPTTTAGHNAFFGAGTGTLNTTGSENTFVGDGAGNANTTGTMNTFIGRLAGVAGGGPALTNATAIGAYAVVAKSDAVVLGNVANVGIGTSTPNSKLHVAGGDAAITTQGNGVVLRATDGANCFRVTVNNAGTLTTSAVTCP